MVMFSQPMESLEWDPLEFIWSNWSLHAKAETNFIFFTIQLKWFIIFLQAQRIRALATRCYWKAMGFFWRIERNFGRGYGKVVLNVSISFDLASQVTLINSNHAVRLN